MKTACVQTQEGTLQGAFLDSVYVFKGVPYAQPPCQDLRWQPPLSPSPWQGIRQALEYSPSTPQNPSNAARFKEFVVDGPQSEDCLYLNVWSPGLDDGKRPVMIWIHGGVFTMGSSSQQVFDGTALARNQDVVVVTLNYRLGLLGFLNLNQVTREQISSTGNEGLLDQIAALQWIKDNIAAFGGDPNNITLFGESAGASSIKCLMRMPTAQGLFHKAILQSPLKSELTSSEALHNSQQFVTAATEVGWTIDKLKQIPIEILLNLQKQLEKASKGTFIAPVNDGVILLSSPKTGKHQTSIPIIIGTNAEEMRLFHFLRSAKAPDDGQLKKKISKLASADSADLIIDTYRRHLYPGRSASNEEILIAVESDLNFCLPVIDLLESRCTCNDSTYAYLFDWQSPALENQLGACHAMEIGFIFGNFDSAFCGSGATAAKLSRQMQSAWAAFARTGNPSCTEIGGWPGYCSRRSTMFFGRNTHIETSPYAEIRQMWRNLAS